MTNLTLGQKTTPLKTYFIMQESNPESFMEFGEVVFEIFWPGLSNRWF